MKKYIKLLMIFLLMFAINVKADYSSTGIVPDYTTVYPGDTITFGVGNDFWWDESIVLSNVDEETDKEELVQNEEGNYLIQPIYVVVPDGVFELDISENKVPNSNYNLIDYRKTNIDGDKVSYEFDLEALELKESNDEDAYDGVIDNILVNNLKFKVLDDATPGTYYVETYRTNTNYDETKDEDYLIIEKLPITIIDKETKENSIKSISLKNLSDGLVKAKEYKLDGNDSNNYELLYYGEVDYTNLSCNTRCLVKGIGSDVYLKDDVKDIEYKITYDDKTTQKVTLSNKLNSATIKADWAYDFNKSLIYIANDVTEGSSVLDKILNNLSIFKDGCQKYVYDYSKLNEIDKEIISNLKNDVDSYNTPYIFIVENENIVYKHEGNLTDEEYASVEKEINRLKMTTTSNLGTCEDDSCLVDTNAEKKEFNIKDYYMYIVIGLSVLIVLLILIISIIKRKNKQEFNI